MKRAISALVLIALVALATGPARGAAPQIRHISPALQKAVAETDYAAVRIKNFPFAAEAWTFRKFTFAETLKKLKELGVGAVEAFPGQALAAELPGAQFSETMTDAQVAFAKEALKASGVTLYGYGVVDIGTTETSMRKVFDFARKMGIRVLVCEPADDDFSLLEKLVKEYNIKIAIHNHPAPAKYNRPETVFSHVDGKDPRIGSCADSGHWMRGLTDPREAFKLLAGRILDVHLKDRSDYGTAKGVDDVAWGSGQGHIRDLLAELTLQDYDGYLTMEYENEAEVGDPMPAFRKSIAYVRSVTYYDGYTQILRRSGGGYEKHGWNHYGPGYFECDPKTGVLKGQGGMGLLWYTKKVKDFVLECDFRCSTPTTNSGIFLRIPEVPVSDDYIYHAIEIQIDDTSTDIHHTGAAYDIEAPKVQASVPTGQWNHFRIEFKGMHLKVDLNGRTVLDWQAHPGGKVRDLSPEGYIGLQNHDSQSPPFFRNVYLKEL
ncbi:MAG: family 16 glycoside hydrolase [Candidatus Aminicenantes bacterium RBG_16_66_30]